MLIENESQWRTEDLKEIVRRIEETPGFQMENFYSGTLLLFKTSRKKDKKDRFTDEVEEGPAAEYVTHGKASERYYDTRLVVIRSAAKLQADVLDRLANSDVQQDMSPADVLKVVEETAAAIGGWRGKDCGFPWYKEAALRVAGPGKRSEVATEREVRALRSDQERVRRTARRKVEDIEQRIQKILSRGKEEPD